jgi:hypothetical protein
MTSPRKTVLAAALTVLAGLLSAAPARAQSDILLQLRSGSPPGDRFRVDSAGGLVAIGTLTTGIIPATGCGFRMMWHPYKAAFRAGSPGDCSAARTEWDDVNVGQYSWAGGTGTIASQYGTFAFGDGAQASGVDAAAIGFNNEARGTASFSAGASNHACGFASVAIGFTSTAGTLSGSSCANGGAGQGAIALGYRVTADADYAVAIGQRASANGHSGAIVFGDESTTDSIQAVANNEFAARAAGGFRFRTNATLTTGCNLPAGSGVFSCASSRTLKNGFVPVDGETLLGRIRTVPVNTWSYNDEPGHVRHLGPFAEDFRAAFGLGTDDRSIGMLDIAGVDFAAVKALEARTADLQRQLQERDRRIDDLEARLARLEAAVAAAKPAGN